MPEITQLFINLDGEKFSPSTFTDKTGLALSHTIESGAIQTRGKYKNKPSPYGKGSILLENFHERGANPDNELHQMLLFFKSLSKDGLKVLGIDKVVVWVVLYYETQCNWEIQPKNLLLMGELGFALFFSAYHSEAIENVDVEKN